MTDIINQYLQIIPDNRNVRLWRYLNPVSWQAKQASDYEQTVNNVNANVWSEQGQSNINSTLWGKSQMAYMR